MSLVALSLNGFCKDMTDKEKTKWFESEESVKPKKKINLGDLTLLDAKKYPKVMHSENKIKISADSLKTGWVLLNQCYFHLNAFPKVEVVYKYRKLKNLKIISSSKIAKTRVAGQAIELIDVKKGASLCVKASVLSLVKTTKGFKLENGPFRRKYLDGYFPMRVSLEITYPSKLINVNNILPKMLISSKVKKSQGKINVDATFEGVLNTKVVFEKR